jgi:hypothetical protein
MLLDNHPKVRERGWRLGPEPSHQHIANQLRIVAEIL